jgi:hypothetical protein
MAFNPYETYLSQPFMNLIERRVILQNNKKLVKRKLNDVLESYNLIEQLFRIPLGVGIDKKWQISCMRV